MAIHKRNILRKKERKHAFDKKVKIQEKRKKTTREKPKISTTLLTTKKKQVLRPYFLSFINFHLCISIPTISSFRDFYHYKIRC